MERFYGCYQQGPMTKMYKWTCKEFSTESEATQFALKEREKNDSKYTMLVHISQPFRILDQWLIERQIKNLFVHVKIE